MSPFLPTKLWLGHSSWPIWIPERNWRLKQPRKGWNQQRIIILKTGWYIMTVVCGERATPQVTSTKKSRGGQFCSCHVISYLCGSCICVLCKHVSVPFMGARQTYSTCPLQLCLFAVAQKQLQKLLVCSTIRSPLRHCPDCLHSFVNIRLYFMFLLHTEVGSNSSRSSWIKFSPALPSFPHPTQAWLCHYFRLSCIVLSYTNVHFQGSSCSLSVRPDSLLLSFGWRKQPVAFLKASDGLKD